MDERTNWVINKPRLYRIASKHSPIVQKFDHHFPGFLMNNVLKPTCG